MTTGPEATALIAAVFAGMTSIITALGVVYNIYLTNKTKAKVDETALAVDGRLTQLLKTTESLAAAQGKAQGRKEVHEEIKAGNGPTTP